MDEVPVKNAPSFGGWAIAAGVGLVTVGVAMVVFGFNVPQATGVAAVLFLVTGLILGAPDHPIPSPQPAARVEGTGMPRPAMAVAVAPAPAPVMSAAPVVGKKPEGLAAARNGVPDDLKIIKGIGPQLEKLCHSLGYYHFDQIANWTAEEISWVDDNLEGFKGRVTRDQWVAQARVLAAGGGNA